MNEWRFLCEIPEIQYLQQTGSLLHLSLCSDSFAALFEHILCSDRDAADKEASQNDDA